TVTFTLTGFSTVKREGIVLTSGFTAPVNAELKVSGVAETVEVTGASPVVDVQNARTQQVLQKELLDAAPSAKNLNSYGAMILGITVGGAQDVGGNSGEVAGGPEYHGLNNTDSKIQIDGMQVNVLNNGGGSNQKLYRPNILMFGEVNYGLGAQTAESETG